MQTVHKSYIYIMKLRVYRNFLLSFVMETFGLQELNYSWMVHCIDQAQLSHLEH